MTAPTHKLRDRLIDELIAREGGYVDDKNDSGGKTNYGITERVARRHGYRGDMRGMPRAKAVEIYAAQYWDALRLDEACFLSQKLAEKLFDIGANCGTAKAAEWLQRALNAFNRQGKDYPDVQVDGDVGPATVFALKSLAAKRGTPGLESLRKAVTCMQGEHYIALSEKRSKDEEFVNGWFANRV
ncbi:MAG: glycosyl hydrolase 108 family protein [Rickettsiales bacterium]